MATTTTAATTLTPVEAEVIAFFVRVANTWGFPRSLGEIYGIVFCSAEPLSLDDVSERLQISRGSASQGLRMLVKLGALQSPYVGHARRTYYEVEPSMRRLGHNVVNQLVKPFLLENQEQLQRIQDMLGDTPAEDRHRLEPRVVSLLEWNRHAQRLIPWAGRILGLTRRKGRAERTQGGGRS